MASEQAQGLAKKGHKVTVLTERASDSLPQYTNQDNLQVFRYGNAKMLTRFGGRSRTDLKEVPRVIKKLEGSWNAAVIHHPFVGAGFLRSELNIPALYIFHASTAKEIEYEGLQRSGVGFILTRLFIIWAKRIEGKVLRRVDRIGVFSDFSQGVLKQTYPFTSSKIVRVSAGIDLKRFCPGNKAKARSNLKLPKDKKIILTVRRLTPRMGLEELVKGMKQVVKEIPDTQLLIVGDGPLGTKLQAEIEKHKLQGKVILAGKVSIEDLPRYYHAADLFVLSTQAYEGLGIATLEALACGLPTIGTPVGATPEILKKINPELVVDGTGPVALAEGVIDLLSLSEKELSILGKKARKVVEEHYDWDKTVDQLEGLLKNL